MSEPFDDGDASDDLAGRIVAGTVAVLVVLMVVAVVVVVVFAGGTRNADASRPVVFTIEAPYNPQVLAAAAAPSTAPTVIAGRVAPAAQGNWTAQRGIAIANRALKWVGTPYSWDAGDANGPTYGVAVDQASRNDGHIIGFDCSGLVLNAIAPWRALDHSAAAQYSEAGTVHPSLNELWPGDLVFWSTDGTINGVHHVAVYIGNGNVVQAPESGSYVQVTRLDQVQPGRIGTTRPLT